MEAEETFKDEPIPTLPVKSENPLTLRPPWAKLNPDTLREAPIPVFPARFDMPDTFKVDSAAAEVTVKDCPIPTLPETFKLLPIPTKSEKYPVPLTLKL